MLGLLDLAGMLNLVGVNTVHLTIARRPADDRTNPARQDFNAINASPTDASSPLFRVRVQVGHVADPVGGHPSRHRHE